MDKLAYLRMVDLFHGLTEEELKECERAFPMFRANRGRLVVTPATSEQALYIVKEGAVRLYRLSADGREVTLGTLQTGAVFGTLPMFGAFSRNTFAEAATDTVICKMDEGHLRDLISRHPDVAIRLLHIIGERLGAAEDQIEDLAFRSAEQRVARSVVRLLDESKSGKLSVSHEEIAKRAGVARETVTKILGGMERQGWIRTGYRKLRVLDRAHVEQRAADT